MEFKTWFNEIALPPGASGFAEPQQPTRRRGGVPLQGNQYFFPVRLSYATYLVFSKYQKGKGDPLGDLLFRRGDSVDWKTIKASDDEIQRLKQVAQEILSVSKDPGEVRTAQHVLETIK